MTCRLSTALWARAKTRVIKIAKTQRRLPTVYIDTIDRALLNPIERTRAYDCAHAVGKIYSTMFHHHHLIMSPGYNEGFGGGERPG